MREALALRLMNDIGVPSQRARYVRLFQNGACVGGVCELLHRGCASLRPSLAAQVSSMVCT
jgi:hypothetical protein